MGTRLSRMLNIMKGEATDTDAIIVSIAATDAKVDILDTLVDSLTTSLATLDGKVVALDAVVDAIKVDFETGGQIPTIVTNTTT